MFTPSKIFKKFSTFDKFKLCRSRDINDLQFWNILPILITDEVSILFIFNVFKDLQSKNILFILTIDDVLNSLKSNDIKSEQL